MKKVHLLKPPLEHMSTLPFIEEAASTTNNDNGRAGKRKKHYAGHPIDWPTSYKI